MCVYVCRYVGIHTNDIICSSAVFYNPVNNKAMNENYLNNRGTKLLDRITDEILSMRDSNPGPFGRCDNMLTSQQRK